MQDKMTGRPGRPDRRMRNSVRMALSALLAAGVGTTLPALASGPTTVPIVSEPAPYYAPAPQPVYSRWEGGYYGFSMGYNFRGRDEVRLAPAPPGVIGTMRARGFLLGVQLGRNWQRGNTVFGVEGGLNLTNTRAAITSGPASASMRINPFADLRGRLGWATNDGLFYGVAGLSAGRIRYAASDGLTSNIQSTYTAMGYSLGLGYEHDIGNDWSMRGEYSYTQYRGRNLTDGVHTTRATPDYHSVRFGLNRRF